MSDDKNNFEDDGAIDFDDGDVFTEKTGGTLGDLWRDNVFVKIGTILGGFALIIAVIFLFNTSPQEENISRMPGGIDLSSAPAAEGATEAYNQALRETNERMIQDALETGGAAIPVPIEPPRGVIALEEPPPEEEDPLERWRMLQEERLRRDLATQRTIEPVAPVQDDTRGEAIQALADLFLQQMQSILEAKQQPPTINYLAVTDPGFLDTEEAQSGASDDGVATAEDEAGSDVVQQQEVLVPAAEIAYAQFLTEANTDAPGPVLAQIVSGPLSGSRILGSFEEQDNVLTIEFSTVVVDQESISMSAIALDPATTLPGLATEVDQRYFKRIVLPAAAAFVEGAAEAIAESGRTTISIQGETVSEQTQAASDEQEIASGVEEAGEELGSIMDEIASSVKPMIRVASGTPFGLLFLEPVTRDIRQEELANNR